MLQKGLGWRYKLYIPLIAHDSVTDVQKQFHLLLDRITPFYQDRLNDLAPAQRALLECMASMRDQEKTPASIAAKMRMSQPETSSLLKRLADARYLRSFPHPRDKRSRLYTKTKLAFLRENLERIENSATQIRLKIKIGMVLMELARWDEAELLLQSALTTARELDSDEILISSFVVT